MCKLDFDFYDLFIYDIYDTGFTIFLYELLDLNDLFGVVWGCFGSCGRNDVLFEFFCYFSSFFYLKLMSRNSIPHFCFCSVYIIGNFRYFYPLLLISLTFIFTKITYEIP